MLRATLSQKQTSNSEEECDWVSGSPMQESLLYERSEEWHVRSCLVPGSLPGFSGKEDGKLLSHSVRQGHESMGWFWFWLVCFEIGSLYVALAILELAV